MSEDTWRDKIALFLWRDRNEYDPSYGTVTHNHLSLKGRIVKARKALAEWERDRQAWFAPLVITSGIALVVLFFPYLRGYLGLPETREQMDSHAGELLLRCTQEANQILRCVPLKK
jgi:hypothetical protein